MTVENPLPTPHGQRWIEWWEDHPEVAHSIASPLLIVESHPTLVGLGKWYFLGLRNPKWATGIRKWAEICRDRSREELDICPSRMDPAPIRSIAVFKANRPSQQPLTNEPDHHQAPWLTPDASIRERVLTRTGIDLAARVSGVVGVSLLILSAVFRDSLTVIPLFVLLAALLLGPRIVAQSMRPEKTHFVLVLCVLTTLAAGAGMTGGASSPLAYLLVVGVVFTAIRGAPQATAVGAVVGVTVLLATTLVAAGEATVDEPLPLLALLTTLTAVGLGVTGLSGAEVRYRKAAILDPLTGLLNRQALEARFEELRRQATVSSSSICFVLFDLDHFKQINDLHGHDVGDQLLRGIGEELRVSLRKFELACRLGGEEFLIVLPGLSEHDGEEAASRLREMVSRSRVGDGISVTASFGVSAGAGEDIEFHGLYRRADQALYAAKRNGRDQVAADRQLGVAGPL